jgi:TPR repeat protein
MRSAGRLSLILLGALTTVPSFAGLSEGHRAFARGDYEEALRELLPVAEQDLIAAYYVGLIHFDGLGVARNPQSGAAWLMRSAEQGHTGAQLALALAYERGEGVEQDYRLAARWMLAAAEGGNADAQYYLGLYYREGQGVVQNDERAYEWIQRSVDYGVSHESFRDALMYLGSAAEWGRGIRYDLVPAYTWFALAASYSIDDVRIHDEAGRAMEVLALRMSGGELAEARRQADAWKEEKEAMEALAR